MRGPSIVGVLFGLLAVSFLALAAPDDDPAERRASELAVLVLENPDVPAKMFSKTFLAQVPAKKIESILADLYAQGGKIVSVKRLSGDRLQGKFELGHERGARTECTIGVAAKEPHRIESLWLRPLGVAARSLAELEAELAKLPGKVSFAVARLGSGTPVTLAAKDADDALAIGSSFKLYVLGKLLDDMAQGKRHWTDVVPLRAESRSLPSGMLHTWPVGAPVTVHTLASLMISISDNTATDNLVALVGRERIERHLEVMGASFPERSTPFLTTGEMFRLKWGAKENAPRFLEADLPGKRALLAAIAKEPLPSAANIPGGPTRIQEIEWFASANDLIRALDWIRRATANDDTGRGVLGINDGGIDATPWKWVGFKGGSEPGVLELAWLLERKDGAWFSVCAGWNNPDAAVETAKLGGIAQRAIELVAAPAPARVY